jgi:hypothetical protein
MRNGKRIVALVLGATLLAAACWGEAPRVVTVPISGRYYEAGAGGWLNYTGAVTFTWQTDGGTAGEWPASATLVAEAWCMNTGAGYTLYGLCTDCVKGITGDTLVMSKPILALDGRGRPAFQAQVSIALAIPSASEPPVVTAVAFVGR